jgi:hypothetical protein
VAAAVLAVGGSVAALTVIPGRDHTVVHTTTGSDTTTTVAAVTTTATPTTTTIAAEPVTAATAAPTAPPVTTEAPTSAASTTAAPTTAAPPPTVPTTEVPTTEAPVATTTPTTEVHAPTTLSLSCAPLFDGGHWLVRCEWSASTAGDLAHYRVLRSVEGQPGRAFEVGREATAYVDTTVEHGVAYRYLVRAERADSTAVETSALVTVTWPAETPVSTTTSTTRA